jgi:hypothetical protein
MANSRVIKTAKRNHNRCARVVSVLTLPLLAAVGCALSAGEGVGSVASPLGNGEPIACATSYSGQSTGTTNQYSSYACYPALTAPGTEWVATFTCASTGDVVVSTKNADQYTIVAVLRDQGAGVDPTQCAAENYYGARFSCTAGQKFYIVVDHNGPGNVSAKFDLELACAASSTETNCTNGWDDDGDSATDCADTDCKSTAACPTCTPMGTLQCNDLMVVGDTANFGATNALTSYSCMPGLQTPGSEYAYRFQPTVTQDVVFTTSQANKYPVLAVIKEAGSGCSVGDCVAGNYYSVKFTAEAGQTYDLIVDGDAAGTFNYRASLICPAATSETNCSNEVDDDGDGLIDCDDSDCESGAVCSSNKCTTTVTLDCSSKLVHGDTSGPQGVKNIAEYSCMPSNDFTNAEIPYAFQITGADVSHNVLVTVSHATSYAAIAVLNDLKVSNMVVNIKNTTNQNWSAGLLALKELITPGLSPQPGDPKYYTYAYVNDDCDLKDSYCSGTCSDDGNVQVLANRWGLTLGVDAWLIPALNIGQSTSIPIQASSPAKLSFVAKIAGAVDDLVAMHVIGNGSALSVPLFDANGNALASINFAIDGYDVNSTVNGNGNASSCNPACPTAKKGCYVTIGNGTTGGSQPLQSTSTETSRCNPGQCIAGNYYSTQFTAAANKKYYIVVEGDSHPTAYDLSVVCDSQFTSNESAATGGCSNGYDNDGDNLVDCDDPDCLTQCSAGNLCQSRATIDCSTQLLAGSTSAAGATNAITSYYCATGLQVQGPEYTYSFTATATQWVNFTLGGLTGYAAVAVIEDKGSCDPSSCLDASYYGDVAFVQAGKKYFVVVDGMTAGQTVDYKLSVVCNAPLTETSCFDNVDNDGDFATDCDDPDCSAACKQGNVCSAGATITCSTSALAGSTADPGAQSLITYYPCVPGLAVAGPEYAYSFTASATGTANFALGALTGYASVAVIEDTGTCDPFNCIGANYWGASVPVVAGHKYFVLVDGMNASETVNYTITATCSP